MNYIQQNFLGACELLLARLPDDYMKNNFATQLQGIVKQKRARKKSSSPSSKDGQTHGLSVRQMNDQIVAMLKGIIRQG